MLRDELLERLRDTHAELGSLLDEIPAERLTEPGVAGDWSVKDMLVHLAWYASEEAGLISEDPDYAPSPLWSTPQDERNEIVRIEHRDVTVDQARAQLSDAFGRLVSAVERLSDEDLVTPGRLPDTTAERPPWMDIADNSFLHEQEHMAMIREWLG